MRRATVQYEGATVRYEGATVGPQALRTLGPSHCTVALSHLAPSYSTRGMFSASLELDVGLREQPALEQLRVGGAIELLERNDDAQAATSPLTPMRPAKHVAAL